jgi:hypothetical protein
MLHGLKGRHLSWSVSKHVHAAAVLLGLRTFVSLIVLSTAIPFITNRAMAVDIIPLFSLSYTESSFSAVLSRL